MGKGLDWPQTQDPEKVILGLLVLKTEPQAEREGAESRHKGRELHLRGTQWEPGRWHKMASGGVASFNGFEGQVATVMMAMRSAAAEKSGDTSLRPGPPTAKHH